jgi:DNA-binding NtrC family response regulator
MQPVKVDIRLLATSNRDLEQAVAKGEFREDLYFRLNVVTLHLPPLRARPGDIQALAEHFLHKYADANDLKAPRLTPATIELLRNHPWRGNVRELENAMHRAVLLSHGPDLAPEAIVLGGRSTALAAEVAATVEAANAAGVSALVGRTVAHVERDLIIDTLQHCLGNRTHAANILGISIRTLRNKLKLYSGEGVTVPASARGDSDHATI